MAYEFLHAIHLKKIPFRTVGFREMRSMELIIYINVKVYTEHIFFFIMNNFNNFNFNYTQAS